MKNHILFLLGILFCAKGIQAQTFPSFRQQPQWNILYSEVLTPYKSTEKLRAVKDTPIAGRIYTVVPAPEISGRIYYRVDSDKVYALDDSMQEFLMYDFSVRKGDSLRLVYDVHHLSGVKHSKLYKWFYFENIDTVQYNSHLFRRITVSAGIRDSHFTWYAGIGDAFHPFYPFYHIFDKGEVNLYFLCLDTNSTTVFQNPDYNTCEVTGIEEEQVKSPEISVYPNPFYHDLGIRFMNSPPGRTEIIITDIYGRREYDQVYTSGIGDTELKISPALPGGVHFLEVNSGKLHLRSTLLKCVD